MNDRDPQPPAGTLCETLQEALAARLAGDPAPLAAELAAHLAGCVPCRAAEQSFTRLWQGLGGLAAAAPSGELRERFASTLGAYREGLAAASPAAPEPARPPLPFHRRLRRRPLRTLARLGPALAALLAGVAIGLTLARPAPPAESLAALRQEVRSVREVLALSLLQQSSASARLEGVSVGGALADEAPEVLAALLATLAADPNANVRLAAVDALAPHAAEPAVQRRLGEALRREPSPLVQIALADALLNGDPRAARPLVAPLADSGSVRPEVREHLRRRLGRST